MKKTYQKVINWCSTGILSFICMANVYAEDILAEPTKDAFDTFKNTGINIILLIEIMTAAYIFSTKERSIKTWIGLPIVILVTAFAKTKFGS